MILNSPQITQMNTDFLISHPDGIKFIIRGNLCNLWCKKHQLWKKKKERFGVKS